ncbi:hypothetical protein Poli38472_007946 [Pythium oligandrum]|uniref:Uncharacterized protein n=1 Tax=Pythium oligandrum TaxID=41045 RepID=A0A8K1CKP6_PYTOL|nr:hypothetical protein Poli38472_007946 [Pythium oligandrum]|eukprot:TMW65304.1 hypothetical protein Poli38472_007946 [Pythium oligandrum]
MSITAYNYLFAKKTLFRHWRRLKLYLPIVGVQIMLLYVFLILSIGFAYLSLVPQMLVILVFPIVKMRLKHLVWKYAQRLDDISTDVTVCLLEISGALFQTVCMQFVTSTALNALVLVTDLVQAVHEVHAYMKMDYLGDGKRMLVTARKIIESSVHPGAESKTESPLFQQGGSSHRDAVTSAVTDGSDRALRLRPSWWRSRSSDNSTGPNTTRYLDEDNPTLGLDGKRRRHLQNVHANSVFIASNAVHLKSSRRLLDLDQAHDEFINPNASEALAQSMHSTVEATNGLHTPPSVLDQTLETTPPTGIHREVVPLQRKSSNRRSKSAVVVRLRRAFRVLRRTKSSRERHRYRYTDSPGSSFQNLQALGPNTKSAAQVYPVTSDEVAEHTSHRDKETTHQIERPTGHKPRRRGLAVTIDGIVIPRRDQARILEQTLQLLFACEVLLFAECMEVVIPFLYALCLGCDWLLPNEQYNLVVRGMSESNVDSMLVSSLVYALLELASLLVMYYVMKTKYGVSAFCQLAFVLEHYVLTLQGKMVGLFIVIWNAATVHQATTFGSF